MVNNGILLTIKNNEILPFVTTWMGLEGNILSKINQRKTNTSCYHSCGIIYMCNLKYKNRNRLTDIENKHMVTKARDELGIWD